MAISSSAARKVQRRRLPFPGSVG